MKGLRSPPNFLSAALPVTLAVSSCLPACAAVPIRHPEALDGFEAAVDCGDGWKVALFRRAPDPAAAGLPAWGVPVILAHGTAVNRHSFDAEGSDMAAWLSGRGFDVWIPEYRGDRSSAPPDRRTWRQGEWAVGDIAARDLPAVLDHVLSATGRDQAWWVGHSLGGVLGMILLEGPHASRIAGLVALGSPGLRLRPGPADRQARRLAASLPRKGPVPTRQAALLLLPALYMGADDPFFHALFNLDDIDQRVLAAFVGPGMEDMGRGTLRQYGAMVETGHLLSADGTDLCAGLRDVRAPALLVAGRVDHVAPPWDVLATFDALGSADKEFVVLGHGWGQRHDYGHMDLVMGDWTEEEVFPLVASFIEARLGAVPPPAAAPPGPAPEPLPQSPALQQAGPLWTRQGPESVEPASGDEPADVGD